MLKEPVTMGWMGGELGVVKMADEDFFKIFETPKHDLVYDNGGVKTYIGKITLNE
jgi:deoxyxylulose-5-phosphate synthase